MSSSAVRIRHKTKAKLEQLLRQANKDRLGKKIKVDDLIMFALGLITEQLLAVICSKMLSNRDRIVVAIHIIRFWPKKLVDDIA